VTTLLVASGGGHLKQLVELAPRLRGVDDQFVWVTWRSPQSESLLADKEAVFVRPTRPRDPVGVSKNLDFAIKLLSRRDVTGVVTTGSQLVLPFLLVGRALNKSCHFIESAARSDGPSLSARISSYLPGMHLYSQYYAWANDRWRYVGSVFDDFQAIPLDNIAPAPATLNVVVTLGTLPRWHFRQLVEACLRVIPEGSRVLWQTGCTDVDSLGIEGRAEVPAHELEAATAVADVVISHAGVGSALTALRCGKRPILVPREAWRGEHVDDHQRQIATELAGRNLALFRTPDTLSAADLIEARQARVVITESLPPIQLVGKR
jgi:UDP-N-acetylglucosamine--N-acetylmuramyl-(pentapeptide) pyrophosphoryl-undecaprenol N-acetylglucosamine transferase